MNETDKRQYYQTWMTVIYDRSMTILDIINPMHCMMLRFDVDNIIGKNIHDLEILADNSNKNQVLILIDNIKKAFENNCDVFFEYVTTHKDGSTTCSICYGELGLDDRLYVNTIKIDEDNIFKESIGFTNYYKEAGTDNLSIGITIRHYYENGSNKYILFNQVAKELFECDNILESPYWNQENDDFADEKELHLNEPFKVENIIRDECGNVKRWLLSTKKKVKSQRNGFYIITSIIDITHRHQKDILLKKQFSLIDSVYKSIPLGIVIYDKNGYLISLNQKDMEIFGVEKKEDVIGVNIFDEPNTPQYIKDKIKKGETVEYELVYDFVTTGNYFKTSLRGTRILAVKCTPILNKENNVDGYLQICEDITSKRVQEKLNNMVYNNIPVGVFVYDKDGIMTSLNKRGREIIGVSDDVHITGKSLFADSHIPVQMKDQLRKGNDVFFEMDFNFDQEKQNFTFLRGSGIRHFDIKISVVKNENLIEGYLLVIQDMSDKVMCERQIEQANLKFQGVFESLCSGIEIYDKNGWLIDCNDYDLKILGIEDKSSILNQKLSIYKNPNFPKTVLDDIRKGKKIIYESWYDFDIVKSENYFTTTCRGKKCLEAKGSPLFTSNKELMGYVFEINDITNSKLQEEELKNLNERVTLSLKAGHVSIWSYDIVKEYLSLIKGEAGYTGISLQDGLNILHPDDRNKILNAVADLSFDKQSTKTMILRHYDKTYNDYRYYDIEMQNQKDHEGKVVSIIGTRRDITERCLKKIELINARKSVDMVMNASNVLAWDYDLFTKKYHILYGNYLLADLKTLDDCWKNVLPEDHKKFDQLIKRIVSGKEDKGMVVVRVCDKNYFPYNTFEHTVISVKNDNGKVVGLIGTMYDITKQLEYTYNIQESRENLNLALEAGGISAWTYNVSKKMFTTLQGDTLAKDGMSMEQNLTRIHPDDIELQNQIFTSLLSGEKEKARAIFRYKIDNIEGGYHYYESRMMVKKENDVIKYITGTQKDVTEDYLHLLALEEQNKRNDLINNLCDVVQWDYDLSTSKLKAKGSKFSMPEIDTTDLRGLLEIIHPDDRKFVLEFFSHLRKGENETNHLEYRVKTEEENGHYKTFITDAIAVKDNKGTIIRYSGIDRDMTGWVGLNEKLIRQYEYNDLVLNNINSGLIYMDTENIVLWTNLNTLHSFTEKLSIDKDHFNIGQRCNLCFCDGGNNVYKSECLIKEAIDSKTTQVKEYKLADNIIIRTTAIPVYDDKDLIKGVLYKMDDITDITITREKLQLTKKEATSVTQILKEIIDKMPCVLYIKDFDDDFRFVIANKAFCNYIGHNEKDVIGKTDYDLFEKENADLHRMNDEKVIRTGEVSIYTDKISSFGGTKYWHITKSTITVDSGKRYTIGIGLDVTKLKENEKELENARDEALLSNQILHEIIDMIPGGIYIKDVSNDLRYIIANNRFCKQINKPLEKVLGNKDCDLFEEDAALLYNTTDLKLLNGEDGVNYDTSIKTNGKTTYLHNTKSIIQFKDGRKMILGVSIDTSEMHKINEELMAAKQKAEESDQFKSRFLANMSHEIRTPLNAIVGFSDLLYEAKDQKEREQCIKVIASNNDLLLRLVGDILDLSKIESGIIDMIFEKFDLSEVFNEIYSSFKQKMSNSEVELIINNPYSKCIVNLDKNRLVQVLTNFLTNSIKYTPIGYIKMWYEYENEGIKLYVKDTGIGISKEKHDKVFTRFEKLDEFAQGTGLGLSICKAIVDVKHGDIGFTSEEGKGSTFWVWFPTEVEIDNVQKAEVTPKSRIPIQMVENENNEFKVLNILVAEDNDSNFLLVKSILKKYILTRAINGKEAVEFARNNNFDLILMDIKMPIMDGLEATKLIREFNKDIQIIALTANAFDADRQAALKSGCSAFMTKPIRLQELKSLINSFN